MPKVKKEDLKIEWRSPSELKPYEANAKAHPPEQIDKLVRSISEFGWKVPLVVTSDGEVIAGHGRLIAATQMQLQKVPVLVADDLTEAQIKAYRLADNKVAESDWISDVLAAELEDLSELDFDLSLTGFSELELNELLKFGDDVNLDEEEKPEIDEEIPPEDEVEPRCKVGELYALGKHKLMVGDCTDPVLVKKLMGDSKYQCMVSDPPYGVDYEGGRNPDSNKPREKLKNDGDATIYDRFLSLWMKYREDKGVFYLWYADKKGIDVYKAVTNAGLDIRALIIWNKLKAHYGNFMAQYMQKHEPCLYCVKDGTNWYGPTNEITVWDIDQPAKNEFHPTQKPLACMERPILNSTKKGDLVVDPFLGSGTTLLVSEANGRTCYGFELNPVYAEIVIQRYEKLTGKQAELIDTI